MRQNTSQAARRAFVALVATVGVLAATACSDAPSDTASSSPSKVSSSAPADGSTPSTTAAATCGARELSTMPLRQKLAQLLVVGVNDGADARRVVTREHVGGVFIGSWTDLGMLRDGTVAKLSAQQKFPLMVTVDQEGGRVNRLKSVGVDLPSAREMAKTKTPAQVRAIAKRAGERMAELGITVDFAPSADVSDESDDEVIGDRSFSNDPAVVTRYAGAFARGLMDAGIMPVYKHFPGHGHGSGDTHTGAVTSPPLREMQDVDLAPFRDLLAEPGTAGVLMGHLIVPGLTGADTPASMSRAAIGMLRNGKKYNAPGFDGVVFTDDLSGMQAITDEYTIEQAVLKAITAGVDAALWLSTDKVSSVLDTLVKAVKEGKLSTERINRSVVRVLTAKGVVTCS
ncbi:glycoside hydrolase family 3 N-terminal domain-containing protein [Gordonia shandongensis]|uniref:glycoside hydrolase family 3 N-terminal domain-containing protein n=1 Tax=Gordonia shandongensis TaxID=376351 RepID=UPI000414A75D|nr:glycoside hydrolase family 3 N-terminal domain-containing protein [Gordonia shandongensis]